MVNTMVLPQEIETFYVIPALRRQLALAMYSQGMKQKDVAEILGINSSAISQYRSSKRGDKITLNTAVLDNIQKSASTVKDKLSYIREMQQLLKLVRTSGLLCRVHKQLSDIPQHCEPTLVSCHPLGRECN